MIQIIVQELESHSPIISLAINAISAALLDSGLSIKRSVAAVTMAVKDSKVKVNPTDEHVQESTGTLTIVYDSITHNTCGIHTDKVFLPGLTSNLLRECIVLGRQHALPIFKLYRETCTETFH